MKTGISNFGELILNVKPYGKCIDSPFDKTVTPLALHSSVNTQISRG